MEKSLSAWSRVVSWIPNILTLARSFLTAALVYFALHSKLQFAFYCFVLASSTDFLDGFLARRLHAESRLGSHLDPVCDKFFSISVFSVLMAFGYCPAWFLGLHIAATLLQAMGVWILRSPAAINFFRPLQVGRATTALQFLWMGLLLLDLASSKFHIPAVPILGGYVLLGGLQVLVFFAYFFRHHFRLAALSHVA